MRRHLDPAWGRWCEHRGLWLELVVSGRTRFFFQADASFSRVSTLRGRDFAAGPWCWAVALGCVVGASLLGSSTVARLVSLEFWRPLPMQATRRSAIAISHAFPSATTRSTDSVPARRPPVRDGKQCTVEEGNSPQGVETRWLRGAQSVV